VTLFDTHSRDQLRRSYTEAWSKRLANTPLTPLEALISDVIALHPEFQKVVSDAEAALAAAPDAAGVSENPFLHMGLHIAVREQVSIDRPPGVRALHRELAAKWGDVHRAEHVLMQALGETLWQAQRANRTPDEQHYLALARAQLAQR
jgi:Domain of unknown function (DUF1841)